VYGNIGLSVYKIDYTLRCFGHIFSVSSPLRGHGLAPLGLLNMKTLINVLQLLHVSISSSKVLVILFCNERIKILVTF